jgi:hypothetical protein
VHIQIAVKEIVRVLAPGKSLTSTFVPASNPGRGWSGRFGHDKPTIGKRIVLLIDHQIGLMSSTRDTSTAAEIKSNAVGLARITKALELPVMISSSNAQWQNGDTLPEIKACALTSPSSGVPASSTL